MRLRRYTLNPSLDVRSVQREEPSFCNGHYDCAGRDQELPLARVGRRSDDSRRRWKELRVLTFQADQRLEPGDLLDDSRTVHDIDDALDVLVGARCFLADRMFAVGPYGDP